MLKSSVRFFFDVILKYLGYGLLIAFLIGLAGGFIYAPVWLYLNAHTPDFFPWLFFASLATVVDVLTLIYFASQGIEWLYNWSHDK